MSKQDYHEVDDLDAEYRKQWAQKQAEYEQQVQAKLGEARANQTKPLTEEQMKSVEQNIRSQMNSQIDQTKDILTNKMFENYGGSREKALKLRDEAKSREDQQERDQKTQKMSEPFQLQQNGRNEKMTQQLRENQDREEKKKKEKEQQVQQQVENTKKQDLALQRQRLRQQFNDKSNGKGKGL